MRDLRDRCAREDVAFFFKQLLGSRRRPERNHPQDEPDDQRDDQRSHVRSCETPYPQTAPPAPSGQKELRRVEALDRAELDRVIQHALIGALCTCPRPFPRWFFPWLKETLFYRALDHLHKEMDDCDALLHEEAEIHEVLNGLFNERDTLNAARHVEPASPGYAQGCEHSTCQRSSSWPTNMAPTPEQDTLSSEQSADYPIDSRAA